MINNLEANLIGKEYAQVQARVCNSNDFEVENITLVIENVVNGNAEIVDNIFLVKESEINIYADKFEANVEINEFDNLSFLYIDCLDVWEDGA